MEATLLAVAVSVGLVAGSFLVHRRRPDPPRVSAPPVPDSLPCQPDDAPQPLTQEQREVFTVMNRITTDASHAFQAGYHLESSQLWLVAATVARTTDAQQACVTNALAVYGVIDNPVRH